MHHEEDHERREAVPPSGVHDLHRLLHCLLCASNNQINVNKGMWGVAQTGIQ